MNGDTGHLPIVHSGPTQPGVVHLEAKRRDEVEAASGDGSETHGVARVGRYHRA